jgi:hypothetical protein
VNPSREDYLLLNAPQIELSISLALKGKVLRVTNNQFAIFSRVKFDVMTENSFT